MKDKMLAEKIFVEGESVADIIKERKHLRTELCKPLVKYIERGTNGKPVSVTLRGDTTIRLCRDGQNAWLAIDDN